MLRAAGRTWGRWRAVTWRRGARRGGWTRRGRAVSRAERKRALTAESSSRWAGRSPGPARTSCGWRSGTCGPSGRSLQARVRRIEARLAVPAGGEVRAGCAGTRPRPSGTRKDAAAAGAAGPPGPGGAAGWRRGRCRWRGAGRALLRKRANLAAAGLTEAAVAGAVGGGPAVPDRRRGEGQAVGERDDPLAPGRAAGWSSSSPRRWRTWRTGRTAGTGCRARWSSPTGATRSPRRPPPAPSATTSATTRRPGAGTSTRPGRPRPPRPAPLDELQAAPGGGGRRQRRAPGRRGRRGGRQRRSAPRSRSRWTWPGCPPLPGTGGCGPRSAASSPPRSEHGARAVVIEDLDFAEARAEGRERAGSRPSRGRRGRGVPARRSPGIPTGKFRDRLVQMTANAGL